MKLFLYTLALAAVFLVARLAYAAPELPPEPDTVPFPIPDVIHIDTYAGKTAQQWHAQLVRERHAHRRVLRQLIHSGTFAGHWLERAFLCIHFNPRVGHGEGAWDANTGNGFFGGVQMNLAFMRTYGPEFLRYFGTADKWPPSVQIAVAIKAYASGRGFYPWPNTARACGLIR